MSAIFSTFLPFCCHNVLVYDSVSLHLPYAPVLIMLYEVVSYLLSWFERIFCNVAPVPACNVHNVSAHCKLRLDAVNGIFSLRFFLFVWRKLSVVLVFFVLFSIGSFVTCLFVFALCLFVDGSRVPRFIDTVFRIPFSSMVTVVDDISIPVKGPHFVMQFSRHSLYCRGFSAINVGILYSL